jgi:predicted transcriptional regulator
MYHREVRTTIELRDEHRARLVELAARRGEKGFSRLVAEALDEYLQREERQARLRQTALAARGSLSEEEGDALRREVTRLREHWR